MPDPGGGVVAGDDDPTTVAVAARVRFPVIVALADTIAAPDGCSRNDRPDQVLDVASEESTSWVPVDPDPTLL